MATDKRAVSVYLAPALYEVVKRAADEDGRTVSNWVERMLANYVGVARLDAVVAPEVPAPVVIAAPAMAGAVRRGKQPQNEPCWCGTGKKFKHCHGRAG